jgi:hypothetical protein
MGIDRSARSVEASLWSPVVGSPPMRRIFEPRASMTEQTAAAEPFFDASGTACATRCTTLAKLSQAASLDESPSCSTSTVSPGCNLSDHGPDHADNARDVTTWLGGSALLGLDLQMRGEQACKQFKM